MKRFPLILLLIAASAFGQKTQVRQSTQTQDVLPSANGGTGVNNGAFTLTLGTNGGTIAFPSTSTTQTFPTTSQTIAGLSEAQTFTNKRITKRRLNLAAPGPTPAINTDSYDQVHITGLNANISSMTTGPLTGTPVAGDTLAIDFTDNGTPRTIAWGASFESSPGETLPSTTVANTRLDVIFVWNEITNKWRCIGSSDVSNAGASDIAYGATWNGVTAIAGSKNAIYDYLHLFDTDDNGKVNVLDLSVAGAVTTDATGIVGSVAPGANGNQLTSNGTIWTSAAPTVAGTGLSYITKVAEGSLSNEFALASLATGLLKNTTTTGVPTIAVAGTDYEAALGNPGTNGFVLASTTAGVRSWVSLSSSAAPTTATYITETSDGTLSAEFALGSLATGILRNTTTTGVPVIAVAADFPALNQNTTGSAASLSVSGQTGLMTVTGLASVNRAKTVRDAADTILELGGSYTPTGTWTSLTMVTPVLGTPTSGNLSNCTFPTLNQNTSGSAATLTTARNLWGQSFNGSANIGGPIQLGTVGTSDTVLDRVTGGTASIAGVTIDTASNTLTLTNKRITKRVLDTNIPSSPVTPDSDSYDGIQYRAIGAALTLNAPSGTPTAMQPLLFRFKDDGTARALTWTTGSLGFRAIVVAFPTTTVANKTTYVLVVWNATDSRWDSLATGTEP